MEILPAIDIKGGRTVRLYQGNYDEVTMFPETVLEAGRRWVAEGATWLHVVDLDGARDGYPANTNDILALRGELGVNLEVGGGLRTQADIQVLLDAGIDRVVLGTAALTDTRLVDFVLEQGDDRLAVALDARNGWVATGGWLQTSRERVEVVAAQLLARGVRHFTHTDIARDGTGSGPNYDAIRLVQEALREAPTSREADVQLFAAGGVTTLEHVRGLRHLGLQGAVIGRAFYTGAITLGDALRVAQGCEEAEDA